MTEEKKSLIDTFIPPAGLTGVCMILSAMSADEKTLQELSRTFTNRKNRNGYLFGHLFIDGRSEAIWKQGRICEGIYQYSTKKEIDINLLHAKVFLLGFGQTAQSDPNFFRVVVYTGNLTTSSINNQLELIWTFDLQENDESSDKMTDLLHVTLFFEKLIKRYNLIEIPKPYPLARFLEICRKRSGKSSVRTPCRFISSFNKPIIEYLEFKLSKKKDLNNIICGSAFFEKSIEKNCCPEVIQRIQSCRSNFKSGIIVLNPDMGGAISSWNTSSQDLWSLHIPKDAELVDVDATGVGNRRLHAKYILFYNNIDGRGNRCERGVFYIGSGNISKLGLTTPLKKGGNIESGVIFDINNEYNIYSKLFVGEEHKGKIDSGSHDNDEDLRDKSFLPFVPVLAIKVEENQSRIIWCEDIKESNICIKIDNNEYIYPSNTIPSTKFKGSQLITYNNQEFVIPVISVNGLINEQNYKVETFQDALDLLENFNNISKDDESEVDNKLIQKNNIHDHRVNLNDDVDLRNYPLHTASELIEKIASINKSYEDKPNLVPEWLDFLESNFINIFQERDILSWKEMGFNFISILKHEAFAIPTSENTERYQKIIDKIITKWEMNGLEEF